VLDVDHVIGSVVSMFQKLKPALHTEKLQVSVVNSLDARVLREMGRIVKDIMSAQVQMEGLSVMQ